MTLVLNEIHANEGLNRTIMVAAADRRVTAGGKYVGTFRKLFPISYLRGALSYFGLAAFDVGRTRKTLSDWLPKFIAKHAGTPDLQTFCANLHRELELFIPSSVLRSSPSGFHICGYNKHFIPEYWFLTNIRDMEGPYWKEIKGRYKAPAPHFLERDARKYGWDGVNPFSCRNFRQIYRNGDFRAHVAASSHIDEIFKTLSDFPGDFRQPWTPRDYREYVEFKFEFIAYLYKKWAREKIIGTPIDVMVWSADAKKKTISVYH